MPHHFTHYWQNQTCLDYQNAAGTLLIVNSRKTFSNYDIDVAVGDLVYSITVQKGILYLIGYIEVGAIFDDQYAAAAHLGVPPHCLWPAKKHLTAHRATPQRFDRAVEPEITRQLRFIQQGNEVAPVFEDPDQTLLDRQTLRHVRVLTEASANVLSALMEPLQHVTEAEIQAWRNKCGAASIRST